MEPNDLADRIALYSSFDEMKVGGNDTLQAIYMKQGSLNKILFYVRTGGFTELVHEMFISHPDPTPDMLINRIAYDTVKKPIIAEKPNEEELTATLMDIKPHIPVPEIIPGYSVRMDYLNPRHTMLMKIHTYSDGYLLDLYKGEDVFTFPVLEWVGGSYPLDNEEVVDFIREVMSEESIFPKDAFGVLFRNFLERLPSEEGFKEKLVTSFSVKGPGGINYFVDYGGKRVLMGEDVFIDASLEDVRLVVAADNHISVSCTLLSNHRPPLHLHNISIHGLAETLVGLVYSVYDVDDVELFLKCFVDTLIKEGVCSLDFRVSLPVPYMVPPRMHYNPPPSSFFNEGMVYGALSTLERCMEGLPSGGKTRLMNLLAWGLHSALLGRVRVENGYSPLILLMEGSNLLEKQVSLELLKLFLGCENVSSSGIPGVNLHYPLLLVDPTVMYGDMNYRRMVFDLVDTGRSHIPGVPDFSVPLIPVSSPIGLTGDIDLRGRSVVLRYDTGGDIFVDDVLNELGVSFGGVSFNARVKTLRYLGVALVDSVVQRFNRGDVMLFSLGAVELFKDTLMRVCNLCGYPFDGFKGVLRSYLYDEDVVSWVSLFGEFVRRLYRRVSRLPLPGRVFDEGDFFVDGLRFLAEERLIPGFRLDGDDILIYESGVRRVYPDLPMEGLCVYLGRGLEFDGSEHFVRVGVDDVKSLMVPHLTQKI